MYKRQIQLVAGPGCPVCVTVTEYIDRLILLGKEPGNIVAVSYTHLDVYKRQISNLGLITACAGVGMHEAVWAAILLIMFHAVSKSLMFLSVGAVENCTGSRNIEDMHLSLIHI